jgi:alkaline phosphatase D
VQKAWLKQGLASSSATFKVLCSSVPWARDTKVHSQDTWDGFDREREELFAFFEARQINGIVLLSADRHRSDAWRIVRESGYDLYDLESSKLTNVQTHPVMPGSLFGYNKKCSFGKLTFRTALDDPAVTYEIFSIDNEKVWELTLALSELTHAGRKAPAPGGATAGQPRPQE